jgi:hypothetical protein
MSASDFDVKLQNLVRLHLPGAARDREQAANLTAALADALGMAVAVVGRGEPSTIDTLLVGCEGRMATVAAEHAPLGKMLAGAR